MALDREAFSRNVDSAIDDVVKDATTQLADEEQENEDSIEDREEDAEGAEGAGDEDEVKDDPNSSEDDGEEMDEDQREDGEEEDEADGEDDESGGDGEETDGSAESTLSRNVVETAVRAGVPINVAEKFDTDAELLGYVKALHTAPKSDSIKTDEEKEDSKEDSEDLFASLPKLDPEVYEPELIQAIDGMKDIIKRQSESLNEYKRLHEASERAAQEAANRELVEWFDTQVAGLGSGFEESLGKGSYAQLDQGSSQFAKRDALARKVATLLSGYQATGDAVPPRDEVFAEAARLVLRDEYERLNEKKLKQDLQRRGKQHQQRTKGKKGNKSESPDDEAARVLRERFPSIGK